jgi:hypothetical protein
LRTLVRCNELEPLRNPAPEIDMPTRTLKTLTLCVFASWCALAQADDPPARVGRVAVAQGQVDIAPDFGAEPALAQVNWPVTSGNLITTARGARTEVRIGSTSIRLDGDSSLEVLELDDANVRLRLHYGSASVRAVNPDTLPGFALETPQVRVRLEQPGRVRIDAERVRDTSAVNVFEGVALVEGGASQITVRAGRRVEIGDEDVRTMAALRDPFDDWSYARDRYEDSAASVRYVGSEMTGYEDLDRYGSWGNDSDYGPLWYPTVVSTWVPYRDGCWAWVEPWGWTWVDNAPWGYAPFHYGRWILVHHRWAWAPGRHVEHPVWAPALVGWVGGNGWSIAFRDRQRHPATGWYPLAPWERYEPHYRAPESHLRSWNSFVRPDARPRDYRPQGLTVVPQDRFNHPGRVFVPRAPMAAVPAALTHNLPLAAPPTPAAPVTLTNRPHRDEYPGRVIGTEPGRPSLGPQRGPQFGPQAGPQFGHGPQAAMGAAPVAPAAAPVARAEPVRKDGGRPEFGHPEAGRAEGRGWRHDEQGEPNRAAREGGFAHPRPAETLQMTGPAPGHVAPAAPAQPLPVTSPTPHLPPQPQPVVSPTPHLGAQGLPPSAVSPTPQTAPQTAMPGWQGREGMGRERAWREREQFEVREPRPQQQGEWHREQPRMVQPAPPPMPAPQPVQAAMPHPAPAPQPAYTPPVHEAAREMPREMPREFARPPMPMAGPQPAPAPAPVARPPEPHPHNEQHGDLHNPRRQEK